MANKSGQRHVPVLRDDARDRTIRELSIIVEYPA
jgi:hypothetical protein